MVVVELNYSFENNKFQEDLLTQLSEFISLINSETARQKKLELEGVSYTVVSCAKPFLADMLVSKENTEEEALEIIETYAEIIIGNFIHQMSIDMGSNPKLSDLLKFMGYSDTAKKTIVLNKHQIFSAFLLRSYTNIPVGLCLIEKANLKISMNLSVVGESLKEVQFMISFA